MMLMMLMMALGEQPQPLPFSFGETLPTPTTTSLPASSTYPTAEICEDYLVDLVFVVDSSASIRNSNPPDGSYDNWQAVLEFVHYIAMNLNIGEDADRVGMVTYSLFGQNEFFLDE